MLAECGRRPHASTIGMPVTAPWYLASSSFQNQWPSPVVWVISCLTVARLAGGHSRGALALASRAAAGPSRPRRARQQGAAQG